MTAKNEASKWFLTTEISNFWEKFGFELCPPFIIPIDFSYTRENNLKCVAYELFIYLVLKSDIPTYSFSKFF